MGHVIQRMYGVVLGPTWLSLASHGKNSVPEVVPENEPSACTSGPFPPDASKSGDPYDAACHGCGQVCDECVEPPLFPDMHGCDTQYCKRWRPSHARNVVDRQRVLEGHKF